MLAWGKRQGLPEPLEEDYKMPNSISWNLQMSVREGRLGDARELMTEMVRYHDAIVREDPELADRVWKRVETVADRMDTYWVPIEYIYPGPGLNSRDALSRSQLRDLIARCRRWRRSR